MGIYNRDYLRDSRSEFNPGGGGGPASGVKILIIIWIVVFLLQTLIQPLTGWLVLDLQFLMQGQVWRLITHGFCHFPNALLALLFSGIGLYIFGSAIEPIYGRREFLAIYLMGTFVCGLGHLAYQAANGEAFPLFGSTGGILTITVLAALHYPRRQILLFFVLPVEFRWLAIGTVVLTAFSILTGGGGMVGGVGHLVGAGFGYLYYQQKWHIAGRWLDRLLNVNVSLPKRKPKFKVYSPDEDDNTPTSRTGLDDQVDAILDKIHHEGEASLTAHERALLKRASERYKDGSNP